MNWTHFKITYNFIVSPVIKATRAKQYNGLQWYAKLKVPSTKHISSIQLHFNGRQRSIAIAAMLSIPSQSARAGSHGRHLGRKPVVDVVIRSYDFEVTRTVNGIWCPDSRRQRVHANLSWDCRNSVLTFYIHGMLSQLISFRELGLAWQFYLTISFSFRG